MTTLQVTLPDDIAQAAQAAGLLSPEIIGSLLTQAVKARSVDALFTAMNQMSAYSAPDAPPAMSPEEIAEEIAVMRAERRKNLAHDRSAH